MAVMEHDGSLANVKEQQITSAETDEWEAMPSGSRPWLTQDTLVGELLTPIPNLVHHALYQGLEVLGDVSVSENSQNDEFE